MRVETINPRAGAKPGFAWASAIALTFGLLFGSSNASAAPPPANTVIGNQASASYTDPSGVLQLATSNLVQTTIQQVGSFTLDGFNQPTTTIVNTSSGAAGTIIYAPHVLTNTGNGTDTFTIRVVDDNNRFARVEVFADTSLNGKPSGPALCTATPTPCVISAQSVAGNNGVFQFLVAYTIPATATTPTTPYDTATITATPGTPALYTASNSSVADKDQVNLTTLAAFSVTKSLSVPAVSAPGGGAWPVTPSSGPRSSSASCSTTWTAGLTSSSTCQYVVFTLNISNTGGAPGKFVVTDTLPSGFTYVGGSAVWSNFPGTALGDGAAGDPAGISYETSGNALTAVVNSIAPNVTQTISFVALVNSTAGSTNTSNIARYSSVDAPTATVTAPGTTDAATNSVKYTVLAAYGLVLGANPSTVASATDTTAGTTPNTTTSDTTTVSSAPAGSTIRFAQTAYNVGDATDTINLSIYNNTFPVGTTIGFFANDGATPMLDSNGDGIVDTGPVVAGASSNFVVRVTLPAGIAVASGPYTAIVRGTSAGDSTKIEATRDTLTSVIGSLVDLTNSASGTGIGSIASGDLGPGPSPSPTTTVTTPAGKGAIFPLFIKNNDTTGPATQTYTLQASQSNSFPGNLPIGWTVKFVASGAGCSGTGITTTTVAAGTQQAVEACVTPPSNQLPITAQVIYFHVVSSTSASTGASVSDTKTDAVTVTSAQTYSATLSPSNSGQVSLPGSVTYAHTLTNTGTQSCVGPYTLAATLSPADTAAGWTAVLYLDNGDGILDASAGDTLVTGPRPGPLTVGASEKYLVKVFAPGSATTGNASTVTVTATFPAGANSCGTSSVTDQTSVITGQIRVNKVQAPDLTCDGIADSTLSAAALSLKPGNCIIYQVTAMNQGASPVSNMIISDTVPPNTTLTGATQPSNQCTSIGITGSAVAYAVNALNISCGSIANTVAPNGSATLTFAVKVNQ